eukprot:scaffold240595_cov63-Attheya_sp.AAC.3
MDALINGLKKLPHSKYHVHETVIDPKIIESVAQEKGHILLACNRVSRRVVTRSHSHTAAYYSHTPNVESPPTKRMRSIVSPPTKRMKSAVPLPIMTIVPSSITMPITPITPISVDTLSSSLNMMELKTTRINELAAIEHCVWLLQQQGPPLSTIMLTESSVSLGLRMVDKQQLMPTSISITITELTELLPAKLSRAMKNVKRVHTSLLNAMVDVIGELFLADTNELLLEWKSDGARYANGEQLPAINY